MHKFAKSDGICECDYCLSAFELGEQHGMSNDLLAMCPKHPHVVPITLNMFVDRVVREVARARLLYDPEGVMNALTEEVGELAAAYVDEPRERIVKEAIQVCAMAIRSALEGDPLLDQMRQKRGLDR